MILSFISITTFLSFLTFTLAAIPPWTPPLSTRGRYVVDATGARFKLKSGSWHGGSGTYSGSGDINLDSSHHANQNSHVMPLALQYVPISQILDSFEQLGINSIRLQWSNEMFHDTSIVQDDWVKANPQFKGMTALQVYDECVKALTARGFAVILNNHTNKSKWCCGVNDGNERWNESQSDDAWMDDWVAMVKRYKDNPRVVAADLYNEVRRDILNDPNWNIGDDHDWYRFAQLCASRIHAEANKDILIIIEGINWTGIPVDGFPHGRPQLTPIGATSNTPLVPNKLIYSAHFYDYTGPNHSGANDGSIGSTSDNRYRDFSQSDLFNVMTSEAGYVAFDNDTHYQAPVWISEFGLGRNGNSALSSTWFQNTILYLTTNDLDFAVWPLVGYLGVNWTDAWALQNWDPVSGKRDGLYDGNDWRAALWTSLVNSTTELKGVVQQKDVWKMVNVDHDDQDQSFVMKAKGDWDSGARKGVCPDGLRLIGLSRGNRALCTNTVLGSGLWDTSNTATTVVNDQSHVTAIKGGDWASGYTKFQCPSNQFVIGYSVRGSKPSSVVCAPAKQNLAQGGSGTKWFDKGDNRPNGAKGGDWHSGQYKAQCEDDEYVAGLAFTTRAFSSPNPAALLCLK